MEKLNIIKNNKENIIKETDNNNINNDLKITKDDIKIEIYSLNENKDSNGIIIFLQYLPVIIIILHIFFELFNFIPIFLCDLFLCIFCCKIYKKKDPIKPSKTLIKKMDSFGKQSNITTDNDKTLIELNNLSSIDKFHKSIEIFYDINQNFSSSILYKKPSDIIIDSGLSYIKGLKGISMIFYLFGCVYTSLYSSFMTEKNATDFRNSIKNILFSIFYIGIKYSPKLLLCTSGFSLFYKLMCFLDEKVENEEEIMKQKVESLFNTNDSQDKRNISNSNSNLNSFYKTLKKSGKVDKLNKNILISFKYVLTFFVMQLNKYIIYILFTCFFLFSLNKIIILIQNPKTIWPFFNNSMIDSAKELRYLLPLFVGFKSYFIPGLSHSDENILDYLYLVFQEIIYFIITTIIIFIGYKKNFKFDRFFKMIFIFLFIFRFVYIFYFRNNLDNNNYFGLNDYGRFYNSIIYDYVYYIIGIHFGMINYVIKKDFSYREIERQNKNYLLSSLHFFKHIKRKSKKFLLVVSLINALILLICCFLQQIIIFFLMDDTITIKNILNDKLYVKITMLLDADIFIIAINFMALCFYIKEDNIINNMFCHDVWYNLKNFYFSFILIINPIILYIIHGSETKIIFNLSNCFLYSFICGIIVFSLAFFINKTFELPFKNIIRFWMKLNEKVPIKKKLTRYDDNFSRYQAQNLLDSDTVNITDIMNAEGDDYEEFN